MIQNIIGGELGSNKAVMSRLQRSKMEAITSEASNIEIPIMVGFSEKERNFSEQCLVKLKRNFGQSAIQLPNLIGEYSEKESQYQYAKCQEKDGKFYFGNLGLNSLDENEEKIQGLQAGQVMAGYVGYLENLIRKKSNFSFYSIFSVPSYFNACQKKQLENAFSIAKFPLAKVIEEDVAIASAYMYSKKQDLAEIEQKTVVFIDVGYSKSNIFVANFKQQQAEILYKNCVKNLGVRNIDKILVEMVEKKFAEKLEKMGSEYPRNNKKIQIRIQDSIEKTRKVLSSITDANIDIECLYEEEDFSSNLTREEFEKMIEGEFLDVLKNELQKSFKYLQNKKIKFDDIEILGGGVRIPIVKDLIQKIFKVDKLCVSMQVESISRGCTIQCAQYAQLFNPLVKVDQYQVINCAAQEYSINLKLNGEILFSQPIKKFQQLPYSSQQLIDITKYYQDQQEVNISVELVMGEEVISTIQLNKNQENTQRIQQQQQQEQQQKMQEEEQNQGDKMEEEVDQQEDKDQENNGEKIEEEVEEEFEVQNQKNRCFKLQVSFSLSEDQQLDLRQAFELFSYDNSKGQKVEYKTPFSHQCFWKGQINESDLQEFQRREQGQKEVDQEVNKLNNLRNNFEKQIYEYNRKIEEELKLNLSQEQVQNLNQVVQENRQWFEENGYDVQKSSVFEDKLNKLNEEFNPYMESLKVNDLLTVEIKNDKQLKELQNQTINGLNLNLRNQNLGDGSGFLGFFKKGAFRIAELLQKVKVHQKIILDIGNANMSDNGVKEILQACLKQENLKEIGIDLESNPESKIKNKLTVQCLVPLYSLLESQKGSLEIFSLCMNQIYDEEFDQIARILYQAQKLKAVNIQIKKGQISQEIRNQFKQKMQHLTKMQLNYINENGEKESF